MDRFLVSTLLAFGGLLAALAVLAASGLLLRGTGKKWPALFYLLCAAVFAGALLNTLLEQSSGIACRMAPERALWLYGGLTLLHLYFLWDAWRLLGGRKHGEGTAHDE